jgi:hypothetical protein
MKKELTFEQGRGLRFISESFKIIAMYIHYATQQKPLYPLSREGILKTVSIDQVPALSYINFLEKLNVKAYESIDAKALVDFDSISTKLKEAKSKSDFLLIKKECLKFYEKWYPY